MWKISLIFLLPILFWCGCSSPEIVDNSLAKDLDVYYSDLSMGFKIKPPLDWESRKKYSDILFVPPTAEFDARQGKALIIIRYEKLEKSYTPEDFKTLISESLEQNDKIDKFDIIRYGGSPMNAFCEVNIELESKTSQTTQYHKNFLTKGGYFQIVASAEEKSWKKLEPLLKASLASFEIIEKKENAK